MNQLSNSLPSGYVEVLVENEVTIKSKFWYKRPENLKGKTGRWSKWGGAEQNDYKEGVKDWWYCQSCAQIQPEDISPMLIKGTVPDAPDESVRVCPLCYAESCLLLTKRMLER